jgi:hypothetical protein
MVFPVLMSHMAIEPPRSPDTTRLCFQLNSTTASLWPLNKPYAHSKVSRFHTSRDASYDADIPIFDLSTIIFEMVELCPTSFYSLITFASHRHKRLSIPALNTLPSSRNLQDVTQSVWPNFLLYRFLKHFPVFKLYTLNPWSELLVTH